MQWHRTMNAIDDVRRGRRRGARPGDTPGGCGESVGDAGGAHRASPRGHGTAWWRRRFAAVGPVRRCGRGRDAPPRSGAASANRARRAARAGGCGVLARRHGRQDSQKLSQRGWPGGPGHQQRLPRPSPPAPTPRHHAERDTCRTIRHDQLTLCSKPAFASATVNGTSLVITFDENGEGAAAAVRATPVAEPATRVPGAMMRTATTHRTAPPGR